MQERNSARWFLKWNFAKRDGLVRDLAEMKNAAIEKK